MATASFDSDIRDFLFRSNSLPMFLYDGGSLRIRDANDAAMATYGYTCREFCSMTILDLRSNLPGLLANLKIPLRSQWTHTTKAGSDLPVVVQVIPGRRGLFLMTAANASPRSDANLVRSEQIHRSLVEECPFGIYRLNLTTSRFEQVNPALLHVLGYSREELCSINVTALYLEIGDRDKLLFELHSTGSVHNFETRFRKKDGSILRASISGYLDTNPENGLQYIQGYVLDTTRQRELEEQLSRTHRSDAVVRLAGGVAHDFNNITQSISLSCELALSKQCASAIESKLLDIMQQAARASEITRLLLAFSCGQVLQPCVVNINHCIREALPKLARVVGVNVSIEVRLDEAVDSIFVDPDQLIQVLIHLAAHARAALPEGGRLQISSSRPPVRLDHIIGACSERCALLTVSNNGIGMDEKTLKHVFEPFFPTQDTTLTSGLGLSTVQGIITQSNGRIECESSPGQGATFRIYLPIAAASSQLCETMLRPEPSCGRDQPFIAGD